MKKIILLIVLFGFNHEIFGQTSVEITPGYVYLKATLPYSLFFSGGVNKGYIGIYNNTNSLDVGTADINTTGDLNLVIAASPRATLKPNGFFGIGTTSPISKLEVIGVANTEMAVSTNIAGFGSSRLGFYSDRGSVNEWRPGYIASADNGGFTGRLDFFTNGAGAANKLESVLGMSLPNVSYKW